MNRLAKRISTIPRTLIKDERGWFLKAITGSDEGVPSQIGEVYITMGKPGHSKGGHYHPKALEWFTIVSGKAVLKLEDIKTHERLDIEMSLDNAISVFVPNNIAHVFVNNSETDFILLAYTDILYDPQDTVAYTIK